MSRGYSRKKDDIIKGRFHVKTETQFTEMTIRTEVTMRQNPKSERQTGVNATANDSKSDSPLPYPQLAMRGFWHDTKTPEAIGGLRPLDLTSSHITENDPSASPAT
jgi:hypothetical protein